MDIVVLIKQIPDPAYIRFDPSTRRLVREGVPNILNPFDLHAIEEALRLRDLHGGSVSAITMGPPQFKESLDIALRMGVDKAIHLTDKVFAGADTLATSTALAMAIRRFVPNFTLILAGKFSWDAETGHVGPQVAQLLDIPHASDAAKVEVSGEYVLVTRDAEDGSEEIELSLPALLTVSDRINVPRAEGKPRGEYIVVRASDLSQDTGIFGQSGSPTWVADLMEVRIERSGRMIHGDIDTAVTEIINTISKVACSGTVDIDEAPSMDYVADSELWVLSEESWGYTLRRVTLELLGKARVLARKLRARVVAISLGPRDHHDELTTHGADEVIHVDCPEALEPIHHSEALSELIMRRRPHSLIAPATTYGRDLMARTAAKLRLGLTADCIDLDVDAEGRLIQYKPAFGGNIVSVIYSKTYPQMATVRPGMFKPVRYGGGGSVARIKCVHKPRVKIIRREREIPVLPDLEGADIVIGVGKGFRRIENIRLALDLAEALTAATNLRVAVGATRDVVFAGWLPRRVQIGVSGRAIAPRLYIAIGISGHVNHIVGIRNSKYIIAINRDPRAPIFRISDLGVVGDLMKIIPILTQRLRGLRLC